MTSALGPLIWEFIEKGQIEASQKMQLSGLGKAALLIY